MNDQLIDDESFDNIRKELYRLIRQFCRIEKISEHNYKINLHDQTPIEFNQFEPLEIEKFYSYVEKYCKSFPQLISNLSYESKLQYVETDRMIGNMDIQKTMELQRRNSQNVVCVTYVNDLFTPENILLGAVILGINSLANKFLNNINSNPEEFDISHKKKIEQIMDFTGFLLRDKFISKLTKHYFQNFQGIDTLFEEILVRLNAGKIKPKYFQLIRFIHIWKLYNKILYESINTLEIKLPSLEQFQNLEKLYEMWVFYKILSIFPGIKQQRNNNYKAFSNNAYTVEYQYNKKIGWIAEKEYQTEIIRLPDIVIKKQGKIIAILDAKYMKSNNRYDQDDENSNPSIPDRNIINQMLIYLDYGKEVDKSDMGVVLFADDQIQETPFVIRQRDEGGKRLYVINMHPKIQPEKKLAILKDMIMNFA